jgi:hypothetical protein
VRRSPTTPPTTSRPRGRQPGQHQRAHRDEQRVGHPAERFGAMTRLDENRAWPSWPEARRRRR